MLWGFCPTVPSQKKGNVSRRILVLDTSIFIHFDDKYFETEGVENRVGDDGARAILQI